YSTTQANKTLSIDGDVVNIDHAERKSSFGIVPLSLGGQWTFSNPNKSGGSCTAYVADDSHMFSCNGQVKDWPSFFPSPEANVLYTRTRTGDGSSFRDSSNPYGSNVSGGENPYVSGGENPYVSGGENPYVSSGSSPYFGSLNGEWSLSSSRGGP